MTKSQHNCNKFWFVWWRTFVCAALVSLLIWGLGSRTLWNRLTDNKSEYLTAYYNYFNAAIPVPGDNSERSLRRLNENLAVINVSDFSGNEHTRASIARLIDTLCQLEPAVVGMDLLFPDSIESSPDDDHLLWDAISRNKDKLVVAAFYNESALRPEDKWTHSFFTEGTQVDFGTVNGQDLYALSLRDRIGDSLVVDKFITKLAAKAGMLPPAETTDRGIINYRSIRLDMEMVTPSSLCLEKIQGKVVLVGEFNGSRDYVSLPFRIEGKSYIPGAKLLVYQLCCLLDPGEFIRKAPFWYTLIVALLLLLLYILAFVRLSIWENNWVEFVPERGACCRKQSACFSLNLIRLATKPILLALAAAAVVILSFVILRYCGIMVDLLPFFIAELFFVDYFCKVFIMSYNKHYPKES